MKICKSNIISNRLKTTITLFLLALISCPVFGQNSEKINNKKISIGFTFSPDYCYRILKSNPSEQYLVDEQNSSQIPKFGYSVGLNSIVKFNSRIAVEFGAQFADKGYQTKRIEVAQTEPKKLTPNEMRVRWSIYFIDIPVKVNYFILYKDFKLFVSAGPSLNLFLYQKRIRFEYIPDKKTKYITTEGFNKVGLTIMAGVGFEYSVLKKLNLRFEPTFRYSLTPLDDGDIKRYPYSIGACFGIYYRLN